MSKKLIPVENSNGLFRDASSNAIINTDNNALMKAKAQKEAKKKEQNRIDSIEQRMDTIESLLKDLIARMTDDGK
jgi:hypothetical protein